MLDNRAPIYIGLSFLAGVLLTLGFKDVYPDLERRFRRKRRRFSALSTHPALLSTEVQLKDNTKPNTVIPDVNIPDGIEGCIGNTPLFRIRSLSEATGCDIFAKAEVNIS